MTKLRTVLFAAALAALLAVAGASSAFAQSRPVAPGNTPSAGFAAAETCSCHSSFIQEWKQSMHAQALTDPLFKTKLAEAKAAAGAPIAAFCLKCHGPVGTMTGQLTRLTPGSASAEGIPCSFCHQVTGASAPTNNVSLLVDPSGTYRAQIATPTAPHAVAYSAFHRTSQICGSCHNVAHPGNGLPVEATYTEWQASPQAKAGIQCQDCHMSAMPGQIGPSMGWAAGGGPRRPVYQMTFTGAQVGLSNEVLATQMLQSAATLKMEQPGITGDSRTASVTVTIKNVGAGHDLPTGLTEVREMWLAVTFTDLNGKTTEVGKHVYGTVLKNAAGKSPAQLWEATGIQSDDRIPPQGSSVSSFKFTFPEGTDAGTIKAQLLYRSAPESLAKSAKVENPTTVMAESSSKIYTSIDAERAANSADLTAASASPLMPLVFAVLGMLLSVGLIIFFVWWGRRPVTPRPSDDAPSAAAAAEPEQSAAEPKQSAATTSGAWADDTGKLPPVGVAEEPDGEPSNQPADKDEPGEAQ